MNISARFASLLFQIISDVRSATALLTLAYVIAPNSLFAQLEFGEPHKSVNINQGPPVGESGAHLSPDGLSFYFSSDQRPGPSYPPGDFYMYVATRDTLGGDWSAPEALPVELNQGGDSEPNLSSDGLSLYFGRGDEIGLARGADIFVATRATMDSPWSDPQPVPGINSNSWSDLSPEISTDGREFYFSSDRPGGKGSADLWMSRRASPSDPWSEPESLDINSALWEAGPDLSPDGLTLFFHAWPPAKDPLEFTDVQIWASQRESLTSPWGKPEVLPDVINGTGAIGPHLSPDGSTFYFSTSLIDTTDLFEALADMDIWQVPVLTESMLGDFNRNGILDANDIDLLSEEVRAGNHDSTFDLNEDGIVDVVDREVWVHNLSGTYFGDLDLDGQFKTQDLVAVLALGEFEDNVALNSTWETGDWDGDADVTSSDLVLALADGGFEQGPRPAVVPEPSTLFSLAIAFASIFIQRQRR